MRKRRARLRILKSFPVRLEEIACAKALDCDTIEIWFADEARIGQKNKTTRRWAKRGTRPSAPRDQRTASTYIFGAVCPKRGTCTLRRSPRPLHPPPTLSSWSTRPAGTCRHASSYRPTSPSSRCHLNVPSSTRLRTCGSSCATTGSRTGSSNHTTILSTIVARPGTNSSISLGASCPPDCANGRTSSDQWDSVYDAVTDRFVTTWAAISVGCEACHGQGSRHVAWARAKHSWWPFNDDPRKGLLVSFDERRDIGWRIDPTTGNARRNFAPATVRKEVETCGRCHARRSEFSEDWVPGRSL